MDTTMFYFHVRQERSKAMYLKVLLACACSRMCKHVPRECSLKYIWSIIPECILKYDWYFMIKYSSIITFAKTWFIIFSINVNRMCIFLYKYHFFKLLKSDSKNILSKKFKLFKSIISNHKTIFIQFLKIISIII